MEREEVNECREGMSTREHVQRGICPSRNISREGMSTREYVQRGICPSGNMSKWEYIQGDMCLGGMYPGGNCRGGGHLAGTPYRYCKSHGDMRELKCCCCKSHVHTVMEH